MSYVRPTLTVLAFVGVVELAMLSYVLWERNDWSVPSQTAIAQETGTCPNAQLIDTFEGNGDQQTDTFNTTTNSFRVSYEVTGSDPQLPASLFIDVIDANDPDQLPVANATQEGDGSGETFVNAPPGTYFLDITFFGGQYTITVEQCEGGNPSRNPGGGTTTPSSQPTTTPNPQPTPQPREQTDLLEAGGKTRGPVPVMPSGRCPAKFPKMRGDFCYRI